MLKKDPSLFTDPPALASLPLASLGRRLGVLNISFSESSEIEQAKRNEYTLLARITANTLNAFLQKAELDQFAAILAGRAVRSEQQYQRLFDSALLGIMRFSPLGELIAVNPACARLFGYDSPKEMVRLLAKRQTNLFAEPHQRKRIVDLVLKARGTLVLENRYLKRDGEKFAAVLHARAVRDVQGNLLGLEGFIQDAGHARGAAVAAARLEEELLRAQRMQSVGTLSCGLNQDLSNALTAMEGFAQIAREQLSPRDPAQESLDGALRACDRAQAILGQLQKLTSGRSGRPRPVELAPLMEETLTLLRAMVPAFIDIEMKKPDRPQMVLAHPAQLSQVAMNLCTNASRAMEETGGLLRVELDQVEISPAEAEQIPDLRPGVYQRMTFTDQGPGVAPDLARRIFQPLFTTREDGQGCGMGLATSLSIVRELGGTITLEAREGPGAVFMVYLPLPEDSPLAVPSHDPEQLPGGNERILFVDDEPEMARMASEMLAGLGYHVTSLTDGREALALLEADPERFDLLLTDQIMPDLSGDRLGKEAKRLKPDLPMVLCTGPLAGASDELLATVGFARIAYKPLRAGELARLVREVLDTPK